HAPPSGRSSRATPVMVAYFSPIVRTDSATRRGSSRSSGCGLPVSIWQKSQRRVHWSPPMRKVASRSSQHSKMLGQPASWQTVWRFSSFTNWRRWVYSGPIFARVLIHSGLRSIGVSLLRTSKRRSLRPSGARVTRTDYPSPDERHDRGHAHADDHRTQQERRQTTPHTGPDLTSDERA